MSRFILLVSTAVLFLSGCASGTFKARQEQREKVAASSGMFCEFLSGDVYSDLDVELSLQMARRCDSTKSFTITNYKNASNHNGVIYCCASANRSERRAAPARKSTPGVKAETSEKAEVIEEQ